MARRLSKVTKSGWDYEAKDPKAVAERIAKTLGH